MCCGALEREMKVGIPVVLIVTAVLCVSGLLYARGGSFSIDGVNVSCKGLNVKGLKLDIPRRGV